MRTRTRRRGRAGRSRRVALRGARREHDAAERGVGGRSNQRYHQPRRDVITHDLIRRGPSSCSPARSRIQHTVTARVDRGELRDLRRPGGRRHHYRCGRRPAHHPHQTVHIVTDPQVVRDRVEVQPMHATRCGAVRNKRCGERRDRCDGRGELVHGTRRPLHRKVNLAVVGNRTARVGDLVDGVGRVSMRQKRTQAHGKSPSAQATPTNSPSWPSP